MSPLAIAMIVFCCSFGAALIGMGLYTKLSEHHRSTETQDVLKLVMGLIATMAALVLSLLIVSSHSSYERQSDQLKALSTDLILLDMVLESYGPDAKAIRDRLRYSVRETHDRIWSIHGVRPENLNSAKTRSLVKANLVNIQNLSPDTAEKREILGHAMQIEQGLARTRLLMFSELGSSIPWPFLTMLVCWLTVLFLGFGLFTRINAIVTAALLVGAISVSSAIFLVLELNDPYHGSIRISDAPLLNALAHMAPESVSRPH